MGLTADSRLLAQAQVSAQIDALETLRPEMIATHLAHLHEMARAYDMSILADLVQRLARAQGQGKGKVHIAPYISAMRDAVGCDVADPKLADALLASISQRLYG